MKHYGYLDMDDDYSDVGITPVKAICFNCGRRIMATQEDALFNGHAWAIDCLCSEYDSYEHTGNMWLATIGQHTDILRNEW